MRFPAGVEEGEGSEPFLSCTLQEKLLRGGSKRSLQPSVLGLAQGPSGREVGKGWERSLALLGLEVVLYR